VGVVNVCLVNHCWAPRNIGSGATRLAGQKWVCKGFSSEMGGATGLFRGALLRANVVIKDDIICDNNNSRGSQKNQHMPKGQRHQTAEPLQTIGSWLGPKFDLRRVGCFSGCPTTPSSLLRVDRQTEVQGFLAAIEIQAGTRLRKKCIALFCSSSLKIQLLQSISRARRD